MWRINKTEEVTNAINKHCGECCNPATAEIAKLFYDLWEPLVLRDERMNTPKRIDILCHHAYNNREYTPLMHMHSRDFKVLLSVDEGGLRFTIRTENTETFAEVFSIHFDQITNAQIKKSEYNCDSRYMQQYEIWFEYSGVDYQITLLIG